MKLQRQHPKHHTTLPGVTKYANLTLKVAGYMSTCLMRNISRDWVDIPTLNKYQHLGPTCSFSSLNSPSKNI